MALAAGPAYSTTNNVNAVPKYSELSSNVGPDRYCPPRHQTHHEPGFSFTSPGLSSEPSSYETASNIRRYSTPRQRILLYPGLLSEMSW